MEARYSRMQGKSILKNGYILHINCLTLDISLILIFMHISFPDSTDDDDIKSKFSLNWEPTSDSELAKLSFANNLLPILEKILKDSSTTEKESRQEKVQYYGM